MPPSAADVGAMPTAAGGRQAASKNEMQHLVESLRSTLEIVGEEISSDDSNRNDFLAYLQEHTVEGDRFRTSKEDLRSLVYKAQWIDCTNPSLDTIPSCSC